jgi:uncharacterized protein (TIGR03437 family)
MRPALFLFLTSLLPAQLIPTGQPIPKGANLPVVFVNGYQLGCPNGPASFSGTFGNADKVLQANQIVSVFFDICTVPNNPSIEALGAALGQFLGALKYTDGTPVAQTDVVAHSMGGLVVRSYLAGKKDVTPASFAPPANPGIRKVIFLATPHFGSGIANKLGVDKQSSELAVGSQFLFDLNTWNQTTDDLRGVDALAVAGNGGTGNESSIPGFDDGVVTLTSSSLAFVRSGRTRVVPFCHVNFPLLTTANYCPANSQSIANITDADNVVGQIVVSFLTNTTAWQNLGQAIESNPVASTLGGINIEAADLLGAEQPINHASLDTPSGTVNLSVNSGNIAYTEGVAPNVKETAHVQFLGTTMLNPTVVLPAATVLPLIVKPGPGIGRVIPAASVTFPLNVAPGQFVAIYGSNLAAAVQQATTLPYPTQLSDAQVLVNGTAAPLQYVSPNQINFLYPDLSTGITQLTVKNGSGQQVVNVMLAAAVPAIFTLDSTGAGAAAAVNATTGTVVTSNNPIHAGDYVSLYLTGLGATNRQSGLDYAQIQPSVTVGGQNCSSNFAGRAPTLAGVDQINCQIPQGVTGPAVPVIVTSNGRASNTVTLAIN